MARHGDMGFADAMSWILPTDFKITESISDYIGLIDTEVLQSIGIFLIFVMVIIVLRRVRVLRTEFAATQNSVRDLLAIEQRRSLAEFQTRRQTAPDGGFALNPAATALKLAVMETELKALKEMVTELRQARDDWKAQAGRTSPWPAPPITAVAPADAPSALASATTVAPEPS
jgi:hypothetical protein